MELTDEDYRIHDMEAEADMERLLQEEEEAQKDEGK